MLPIEVWQRWLKDKYPNNTDALNDVSICDDQLASVVPYLEAGSRNSTLDGHILFR